MADWASAAAVFATAAQGAGAAQGVPEPGKGPFGPTYQSLAKYRYPRWFRDAKLGIWAHWGPQAVPMWGDWYARNMYIQGHPQYQHHLENYGHPSKTGWKDIVPLWKAEKWDPERLMALYKKAGAKYFVSMGVHHDNFDLWNSTHNPWNAVKMGPKRDVVGDWQKAAQRLGLKFGVSEHLGASFWWFQTSRGSDKEGILAGVPYDGADPANESLYHFAAEAGDSQWYSQNPRWHREWYARITDLIDQYHPDLLYTDGGVPFDNETGRAMIAHLYNDSAQRHAGKPEVVYTCKQQSNGMWVEDLERGVMSGILPQPWQTDTSIGDWYYNKNWKYRGAEWVIHMLVDIVSKNGNLLINVVQRPDGSLDPEAEQVLAGMADWMAINGEAIYGTRPWLIHGEGPVRAKGGHFGEDFAYSARDIRFTAKGSTLYAAAMGWPEDGKLVIRSLAKFPGVTGEVARVSLLGSPSRLQWEHADEGLVVQMPAARPCEHAVVLKIAVRGIKEFRPELALPETPTVAADSNGVYTLDPNDAVLKGSLKTENQGGEANIGFWDNASDTAEWKVDVKQAGRYRVTLCCAAAAGASGLTVECGGKKASADIPKTDGWDRFVEIDCGILEVKKTGSQTVIIKAKDAKTWKAINLRWVRLSPP